MADPASRHMLTPKYIRALIDTHLRADADLEAFIFDYFPQVKSRLSDGMTRTAKVNLVLSLVPSAELVNRLVAVFPDVKQEHESVPGVPGGAKTPLVWLSYVEDEGQRSLSELRAEQQMKYLLGSSIADRRELLRQVEQDVPQAGYLVIDDFHLLPVEEQAKVARLVKRLCDRSRRNTKVVIVGINPIGASLVDVLPDIRGRYTPIRLQGRQPDEKIDELITLGERAGHVELLDRPRYIASAEGSFALAQRLCYEATRLAGITERPPRPVSIDVLADTVVKLLLQTLEHDYRPHLLDLAAWDKVQPPRGACLYLLIELAEERSGSLQISEVRLRYRQPSSLDAAFTWLLESNLARLFEEQEKLRKLLYYNPKTKVLAAEDPQLWFYLRHIDWMAFARASGHDVDPIMTPTGRPIVHSDSAAPGPKAGTETTSFIIP